ncbi:mucin-binding protein, partial [Lactobacillus delbrueckii]|uniref:mucin-binding protein n=1 Tax=Lactobacillus delbrueckii TaxID=1584 RepID=UPI0039962A2F
TVKVVYTANKQKALVRYIDQDGNNAVIETSDDLTGSSKDAIAYSTEDTIKKLEAAGYVFVSSDYPTDAAYDNDDSTEQIYTVVLKHQTQERVNTKDAKQTVHYVGTGLQLPDKVQTQKDAFKQVVVVDLVTGKVVEEGPWTSQKTFGKETVSVINGYHSDKKIAGGLTATPDQPEVEETVTYVPNGRVILVDKNGQQLPGTSTDQYTTDPEDPTKVLDVVVPEVKGYQPQTVQVGQKLTPSDPSGDTYIVYDVPAQPVEPSKPTEPTKPETPEEPTTPEQPTEPTKPETPVEPTTPEQPTGPTKPETPEEPTTPEQPTEPTKPETPVEPTTTDQPTEPTKPETPEVPTTPEQPTEPTKPETPEEPTTPEQPTEPTKPETPVEPTTPDQPTEPTKPVTPEEPAQPEQPTEPTTPETPVEPSTPDRPTVPSKPVTPEEPAQPEQPTEPTTPETPVEPSTPDQPTVPSKPSTPEGPAQPEQPSVPSKPATPAEPKTIEKKNTPASPVVTASQTSKKTSPSKMTTAELPQTGSDDKQSSEMTLMGAILLALSAATGFVTGKKRKKD